MGRMFVFPTKLYLKILNFKVRVLGGEVLGADWVMGAELRGMNVRMKED